MNIVAFSNLAPKKTIIFAWGIEGVCITIGFMVAAYVGFEAGTFWAGLMAAVPFLGAAVVEFGRIPLVEGFYLARGAMWKMIAAGMIIICAFLTTHNLLVGFERAFNVRVEAVNKLIEEAASLRKQIAGIDTSTEKTDELRAKAMAEVNRLNADEEKAKKFYEDEVAKLGGGKRQDLIKQQEVQQQQLRDFEVQGQKELEDCHGRIRAICDSKATQAKIDKERLRREGVIADIGKEIKAIGAETEGSRKGLQDTLNTSVAEIKGKRAPYEKKLADLLVTNDTSAQESIKLTREAEVAERERDSALRTSQMHRLAQSFLGKSDSDATKLIVTIFSIIIAWVMSLAGSVLAIMYYRIRSQPAVIRSSPLIRSVRGLIARRRRKYTELVTVEKIVEVKVPELIMVPVPLDATEELRRQMMERASKAHTAPAEVKQLPVPVSSMAAE